jgi:predicted dehydrogenase
MKYIVIGAGSRGTIYGTWAYQQGIEIAAIAELRPDRLAEAARLWNVPKERCFISVSDLFALGKIADAAIIATLDRDHYGHVMQALDCGYDILLEKPISPDPRECMEIEARANSLGKQITVCHVLRYTNFWGCLKEVIDSGELGKIVAIKHSENIGNFHMAHSFVRGNWRNDSLSSPIILQKSCHDLDILLWLTGAHCTKVAAFGSLSYFKAVNAPAGSTDRCVTCPVAENCRFEAKKCYLPTLGTWPTDVVCLEQTQEALMAALQDGPYGRCVYRCDNNVCDHMSMILEFDNEVTATFSLTAQTGPCHRQIRIMCQDGEILADDSKREILIRRHVSSPADTFEERTIHVRTNASGHGGGDAGIMEGFTASLSAGAQSRSTISASVESHLMACALEDSRLTGRVVDMEEYRKSLT